MSDSSRQPARVGIRELRQNLSVYIERVKDGETLEVTDHGRPVARLGPRPIEHASILDRLIAEGRATPPTVDHRTIEMPPKSPGRPLSEILHDMRDEDDR